MFGADEFIIVGVSVVGDEVDAGSSNGLGALAALRRLDSFCFAITITKPPVISGHDMPNSVHAVGLAILMAPRGTAECLTDLLGFLDAVKAISCLFTVSVVYPKSFLRCVTVCGGVLLDPIVSPLTVMYKHFF